MLALGDSITAARRSWVHLLAEELEHELTSLAQDGAVVADVLHRQLPRASGGHELGCLYAGVNDARGPHFDPDAYERDLAAAAAGLGELAARVLLLTMPLDLGRPTAAPKPELANAAIRRIARAERAILCPLDDLAGPALLEADAVHPTQAGQREIAARALAALTTSQLR